MEELPRNSKRRQTDNRKAEECVEMIKSANLLKCVVKNKNLAFKACMSKTNNNFQNNFF